MSLLRLVVLAFIATFARADLLEQSVCAESTSCDGKVTDTIELLQSNIMVNTQTDLKSEEVEVMDSERRASKFATVPVKFIVITKTDGTGNLSRSSLASKLVALRQTYNGDDPNAMSEAQARALDAEPSDVMKNCGQKCDRALCYEGGKYKDIIDISKCFCDNDYCKKWTSLGKMHGPRANAEIDFQLQSVRYVTNDVWHDQCCCAHAGGLSYTPKQTEIMDALIDKSTVRSVVTVIVCDMKSTAGQAIITGSKGCDGGPGIMLTHSFEARTLAHEFGHFFGLYHTFNEECPAGYIGGCKSSEVCDETKNIGDRIADTPVHKKQGSCAGTWDADSCPGGGHDPLDNLMSYSGCQLSRFTPGQVAKMKQIITDYYPAFLTTGGGEPKDLPCDPAFPSLKGKVPAGYAPPKPAPPPPSPPGTPPAPPPAPTPSCNLEKGQCDTHDKKGCICHDASFCCAGHGCGGMPGQRQCLPCQWKDWGTDFTKDSCK